MKPEEIGASLSELEAARRALDEKIASLHTKIPVPTLNGRAMRADGFFYDVIDGKNQRVCEDCENPIPRYKDFPHGLTSPESDGDGSWNQGKKRHAFIEGKSAIEPLSKAVCLDCYLKAFARVYPTASLPEFSRTLIDGTEAYSPDEIPELVFIGDPKDR